MTQQSIAFCEDRYKKSFDEISSLRAKMPEGSFSFLASEVLNRVSQHAALTTQKQVKTTDAEIEELARALISQKSDAGSQFIYGLQNTGASVEDVYLSYLAHAARKLGTWWEEDRVSLLDVTVGTGRIYAIMRAMADLIDLPDIHHNKTAVFSAVPGETHTLGVRMAADLFRKSGWEIDLKIGMTHDDLVANLAKSNHVLIGLSGGGEHCIVEMARLVVALRISNPKALIFVSGNIVNESREIIEAMDVDAFSNDFEEAQAQMDRLWAQAKATAGQKTGSEHRASL
jgi:methanogenic corrinoid protein MtbC1